MSACSRGCRASEGEPPESFLFGDIETPRLVGDIITSSSESVFDSPSSPISESSLGVLESLRDGDMSPCRESIFALLGVASTFMVPGDTPAMPGVAASGDPPGSVSPASLFAAFSSSSFLSFSMSCDCVRALRTVSSTIPNTVTDTPHPNIASWNPVKLSNSLKYSPPPLIDIKILQHRKIGTTNNAAWY